MYQGLTGDSEPLFTFPKNPWVLNNITEKYLEKYQLTRYQLDDEDIISSFTRSFYVDGKKELYLEVLKTIDNMENRSILESMNVYVNGQLLQDKFPKEIDNGLLDLGTFENEEVKMASDVVKKKTSANRKNVFYAAKKDNSFILYNSNGKTVNDLHYIDVVFNDTYPIIKISTNAKDALLTTENLSEISLTSFNSDYKAYDNYIIVKNEYYNYEGKLIYVDNSSES